MRKVNLIFSVVDGVLTYTISDSNFEVVKDTNYSLKITGDFLLDDVFLDSNYWDLYSNYAKLSKEEDGILSIVFYSKESNSTIENLNCLDVNFSFYVNSDYTDTELSAISHAQSILYRAGLKDLASSIGAPRPKKP